LDDAWQSYQEMISLAHVLSDPDAAIPLEYLHRLVRLFATERPKTRTHFDRLLEVMGRIHDIGGVVQTWEWNTLIDSAGKGWRKTTSRQFKDVEGTFDDLIWQRAPGTSLWRGRPPVEAADQDEEQHAKGKASTITLSTLLNLASRTKNRKVMRRATNLLHSSNVPHSREIYLTLLAHHTRCRDFAAIKSTASHMKRLGIELGLDGLNSYMSAMIRVGRLDVAEHILIALKGNRSSKLAMEAKASRTFLATDMALSVPNNILPDYFTYTTMIQAHAYVGNFRKCLMVFRDMVEALAPPSVSKRRPATVPEELILPAYRAIFLGFYYHSLPPSSCHDSPIVKQGLSLLRRGRSPEQMAEWSLAALNTVFNDYLQLPHKAKPHVNVHFWILNAFETLAGEDRTVLQDAIARLEERFGEEWEGRLARWKEKRLRSDERNSEHA